MAKGLDKFNTGAELKSVWRSQCFAIGKSFIIKKIRIPLGATLASGMTIVPKIIIDDASSSKTLTTINSTNYTGRQVTLHADFSGTNNFMLELRFTGSIACPVILPIVIDIDEISP